jgi:hypothetical protein
MALANFLLAQMSHVRARNLNSRHAPIKMMPQSAFRAKTLKQEGDIQHSHAETGMTPRKTMPGTLFASKSLRPESEIQQRMKTSKAWFERLDAPTWEKASEVMSAASHIADNAKIAKPSWASAAQAVSHVSAAASSGAKLSEEEQKKRWLSRLDKPTWAQAAQAAQQTAKVATNLEKKASSGALLTGEEEAKSKWLGKLPAQEWQNVADTVSKASAAAHASVPLGAPMDPNRPKPDWL